MGTLGTVNHSRAYAHKLFTVLALTALLGAQLIGFNVLPAQADSLEPGDPGTVSGWMTFTDGEGNTHTVDYFVETGSADIYIPGYLWDESGSWDDGQFHLSCSETLLGTTATVDHDSADADQFPPFSDGTTVTIIDFDNLRVNNGGQVQECEADDFVSLDLDKATTGADPIAPGEASEFTVTGTVNVDKGTIDALNVTVTDTLPEPFAVEAGEQVTWSTTTGESGVCDVSSITGSDGIERDAQVDCPGDQDRPLNLSDGDQITVTIPVEVVPDHLVEGDDRCGTQTNTATIDADTALPVEDSSNLTVDCPQPPDAGISVTKDVDPDTVLEGHGVTWSVTVENSGETDLTDLEFVDEVEPACVTAAQEAFDAEFGDGIFPEGADFSFDCDTDSLEQTTTNTFQASGLPDEPGDWERVSDSDDATATVVEASIGVVKTADPTMVLSGGSTTWTVEVTNTGQTDLEDLEFTDLIDEEVHEGCEDAAQAAFDAAYDDGIFPAGGDFSFTCTSDDLTDDTTNVFTADGLPVVDGATDDDRVTDTADATVTVVQPSIAVEKTAVAGVQFDDNGSPFVVFEDGNGSHDITYEFEITNTGDEDLIDLSLADDKIGDLSSEFQEAVGDGPFTAGDSVTVTASHEDVTAEDFDEGLLTNVAVVSGDGSQSGETATDTDDEMVFDVDVLDVIPAITVDKSAIGGVEDDGNGNWVVELADGETATITYEFLVSNPSEDALTDLTLVDDKIGDLSAELEQALIEAFGGPVLPPESSVTVTADYATTAEDFDAGSTTNVVDVEGIGEESGVTVSDSDDETVSIVEVMAEVVVDEPEDDVEVAAEVETLPRTGLDSANMLLLGLLFTLLGAAAIVLSPGRRGGPGEALST